MAKKKKDKPINYDRKLYAILDGPWLGPAMEANRQQMEHEKKTKPALKAIENRIGQKVAGTLSQSEGFGYPGIQYSGFATPADKLLADPKSLGLKNGRKGTEPNYYFPRAGKAGQWLRDILEPLNHGGFSDFLRDDEKGFPYAPEFIICEDSRCIGYCPRAIHGVKGRTLVSLGYDKDVELEPRGMPYGLLEVPAETAKDWINGKIKLELTTAV